MHVPDHLGGPPAPFPVMTTIAMATSRLRVGTFVINSAFYRPALLARDVAALRDLTEGRFDLGGLGTGYVKEEFDAAGIPFPSAGERVDHLRATTEYMAEHLPDVPIMIAGNGDRVLRIAARSADIIGLTGGGDRAATATGGIRWPIGSPTSARQPVSASTPSSSTSPSPPCRSTTPRCPT